MNTFLLKTAVAVLLGTGAAWAQVESAPKTGAPTVAPTPAQEDRVARGDRVFMEQAAQAGLFEVEASRLAASRASDPAVRSFAAMLVDHHTAASNELSRLAVQRNVKLPGELPRELRKDLDKLRERSGADFDGAFVLAVGIRQHQADVNRFEKASRGARDPQLKLWIDRTLPVLREHLAQALRLPQSGKTPARAG